jgi:hypothetical protein
MPPTGRPAQPTITLWQTDAGGGGGGGGGGHTMAM